MEIETPEFETILSSIPYIRLMLRSSAEQDAAEPVYTLEAINDGEFEADLRLWCTAAQAWLLYIYYYSAGTQPTRFRSPAESASASCRAPQHRITRHLSVCLPLLRA